jgi:hypothetical protein
LSNPDDKKDLDAERDWLAERWHDYAKEFVVFATEQQPAPGLQRPSAMIALGGFHCDLSVTVGTSGMIQFLLGRHW